EPVSRSILKKLSGGLVVSCQAPGNNPLRGPAFMAAMAEAAMRGGAKGIRADGVEDIRAIRQTVGPDVPLIGILKTKMPDGSRFVTASSDDARAIIDAGASLVALDGTRRQRPGGESLPQVVASVRAEGVAALADCSTADDARYSLESGVDAVGSTLAGYTPDSDMMEGPDFALLEQLVRLEAVPVFAEGRIWTREDAVRAFDLGADFIVVGTAITNPMAITERFVAAISAR
ncbi:MAG: N-acetylmannosamine-6-phosphate 2-epimerase, partial [Thermomicrobiales bacterium]